MFVAVLMKTAHVTITFSQLTSHLASEAVNQPDVSYQLPSRQSAGWLLSQAPGHAASLFVSQLAVLVVTPYADQVLHSASGVRPPCRINKAISLHKKQ